MKTQINRYLLSVLTVVLLGAFQTKPAETIIGTWKLTSLTASYPSSMPAKKKSAAEKDIKETQERLKKTSFIFTKDGYLTFDKHKGAWTMSDDGKSVTFINDTKEKTLATITVLTEHQLVFTRVDDGFTQTFSLVK